MEVQVLLRVNFTLTLESFLCWWVHLSSSALAWRKKQQQKNKNRCLSITQWLFFSQSSPLSSSHTQIHAHTMSSDATASPDRHVGTFQSAQNQKLCVPPHPAGWKYVTTRLTSGEWQVDVSLNNRQQVKVLRSNGFQNELGMLQISVYERSTKSFASCYHCPNLFEMCFDK